MPSSGAGGWRRKSEEYITNKSSALFTSRTGLKTKFHTKMVTIWFFPGKKGERRWHSTTAEARGTPRWPPFIVWVCVYTHSHCAYIGGTNRRWLWVWIYGGGVWGDLFEELMYALHKLFWAFFFILKKTRLSIWWCCIEHHCPTKDSQTDALFFSLFPTWSYQYLDLREWKQS